MQTSEVYPPAAGWRHLGLGRYFDQQNRYPDLGGLLERKGVLPITIFPVILGMVVNEVWAVRSHFIALGAVVPVWIMQTVLIALFAFSYLNARDEQGASKSAFF